MTYAELLRLYFDRSNALQWYWTLYVVVIGGLLAFSSLRKQPDVLTAIVVTVLYCCFAYKNLGAIRDTTTQRLAIIESIRQLHTPVSNADDDTREMRGRLEPTLMAPGYEGMRNFHVATDLLTLAAVWGMERRRWRHRTPAANLDKNAGRQ